MYFSSEGEYESVYHFNGSAITSTGEWEWTNESEGKIRIFNLVNNAVSVYHGKVSDLNDDTMKMSISLDEGESYSQPYNYQDTDN